MDKNKWRINIFIENFFKNKAFYFNLRRKNFEPMRKIWIILLLSSFHLYAQEAKETMLDSITISGYGKKQTISSIPKTIYIINAKELKNKPAESLDDILQSLPGIDIRTRGSKGVQADVSIRGGNFDQALILLNGVPINNPQTGHHSLDLPVDLSMIEKIEILEGASGQAFGVNAYSGAINIITKNPTKNKAFAGLKIGQHNYIKTDWNLSHQYKNIAVFNGLTYQKSEGYLTDQSINNTDFLNIKEFLNLVIQTKKHPLNIQLGYHQKNFGANSFYTSKYPWQYEKTKGYLISLSKKTGKKILLDNYLNYRLHYDEFQLFRQSVYKFTDGYYVFEQDTAQYAPGFYYKGPNYHKTQSISGGTKTSMLSRYGKTNIQIEFRHEKIWSNVLGKTLDSPIENRDGRVYTKSDERYFGNLRINQMKKLDKYHIGGGLSLLYNTNYKLLGSGGIYLSHINQGITEYISINSAVRIPTFTDLYYQGPSNIGNPDLKPEKAFTYEAGLKYHKFNLFVSSALFYRQGINTIDWIKKNPSDKWQPQNLTKLNTYGIEVLGKKKFKKESLIQGIQLSYAYLSMNKKANQNFISKYALDYLKHKITAEITHKIPFGISAIWQLIYKEREGQYLDYINNHYQLFDYKPYFLTHLKFTKQYKNTSFELSIENLFDQDYRDLSYIKMPGRWLILGLNYEFAK